MGAVLVAGLWATSCGGKSLVGPQECGNGVIDAEEECDGADLGGETCASLGWESGTLACDVGCHLDESGCEGTGPECGNGAVELGESCDGTALDGETCQTLGWAGGTLTCSASCDFNESGCTNEVCGNGVMEGIEECDASDFGGETCVTLGWDAGALSCTANCLLDESGCYMENPICGDGVINAAAEECDGSDLGGTDCVDLGFSSGTLICGSNCYFDTSQCVAAQPLCGDGTVNQLSEQCDGNDLDGESCQSIGFASGGTLSCTNNCNFDTSGCIPIVPVCGDGTVNQTSEECDGNDLDGNTCLSIGYQGGTLGCTSGCLLDTSGCTGPAPYCGDGIVNPPNEECDGNDLDGWNCPALGYQGGAVSCSANCTLDVSQCWGTAPQCGDGVINLYWEECDGSDLGGETCQSLGFAGGTLDCTPNCSWDLNGCTGGPSCSPAGSVSCNSTTWESNAGGDDLVDYWSNCVSYPTTGPEMVYTFTNTGSASTQATVTLFALSADLDLMILTPNGGGCDPLLSCGNNYSDNSGTTNEQITLTVAAGATYYIVVDGYDGATSDFALGLGCN